MTYEVWLTDDAWIILPFEENKDREYLEQTSTLMWSVEASSYDEALELYDDYLSLEIREPVRE
jgi:hypothetical protein